MNPTAETEFPLRNEFDSLEEYEEKLRERYAMCLHAIAKRVTMRNEEGKYPYFIPETIGVVILNHNKVYHMRLLCTVGVEDGRE